MATKNYQTQFLLVIHKKTFLNAEPVTAAKKTDFIMFNVSVLCFFSNYFIHLNDNFVEYLEKSLTEAIPGAYAI